MREMRDSGVEWIGNIPAHWKIERLQWHVSEIKESNKPEKTRQVLSLTNKRGVIPYEEKGAQGNVAKEDYSQYKLAYPGTIVANSMNILIGSVGRCDYYGCVSPVYYVYKPNEGENLEFISFMFQMEQFQRELRRYANGILEIRLRVSSDGILKREMAFPPINEQERIVEYLGMKCSQVDDLIANVQAQIEKLKAYKQSVITENIAPQDDWRKCRLGQIANFKNGLNYNGLSTAVEIKFLGVGDFHQNFRMDKPEMFSNLRFNGDLPKDLFLQNGDIVFVRSNGSKELVGRSVLIDNVDYPLTYSGFCIRMRNLRKDIIRSEFLMFYFWSHTYRQTLNQNSRGTNISNLNQEMLSALEINFPNIELQDEIVDSLSKQMESIDRLIAIKQAKIEKLEQYKCSLIYEYVTGKKEV